MYGLKQAGRLWSKLLHKKLEEIGFHQCMMDMCVYHRRASEELAVIGVYVDDLLVTKTSEDVVEIFLGELKGL